MLPQLQTEDSGKSALPDVQSALEVDSFHRNGSYLYLYNLYSREYEDSLSSQSISSGDLERDNKSNVSLILLSLFKWTGSTVTRKKRIAGY